MSLSQHDLIRNYLDEFHSISPFEAFTDLGITKLATRISEMREKGYDIVGEDETRFNRFGKKVTYKRYRWGNVA